MYICIIVELVKWNDADLHVIAAIPHGDLSALHIQLNAERVDDWTVDRPCNIHLAIEHILEQDAHHQRRQDAQIERQLLALPGQPCVLLDAIDIETVANCCVAAVEHRRI